MALQPKYKYSGVLIAEADREKGEKFDIIAAVTDNGKCPFWDEFFLDLIQKYANAQSKKGISDKLALNKKDKINYQRLDHYFERFVKNGPWNNRTQMRPIEDGFYEFKCIETDLRVLFYYDDLNSSVIILTHYFDKGGSEKTPLREKERMHRIKESFEKFRRKGAH